MNQTLLKHLFILFGLVAVAGGSYALARLLPDPALSASPALRSDGLPPPRFLAWYSDAQAAISVEPQISIDLPFWIYSFDLKPGGQTLALATSRGLVLFDLESRQTLSVLNEDENFYNVEWSPDGKKLAAGGLVMQNPEQGKAHLIVWDASSWKVIFEPDSGDELWDMLIADVAWSPDGRYLASSNGLMGVIVYNIKTGKIISQQDDFAGSVRDISWSPDNSRLIATGDMAYGIRRWKVSNDEWVRLFDRRLNFPLALEWSPDGKRIASTHVGGGTCLWTASTNECDGFIQTDEFTSSSLAWLPDGSQLAVGGFWIRIVDAQTGKLLNLLGTGDSFYTRFEWLDSTTLASLENDETNETSILRFWNVKTGQVIMEILGQVIQ